jgi:hypothetical protein
MYKLVVDVFDNHMLYDLHKINSISNECELSLHELSFKDVIDYVLELHSANLLTKVITVYFDDKSVPYNKKVLNVK